MSVVDVRVAGGDWTPFGDVAALAEAAVGAALAEAGLAGAGLAAEGFEVAVLFADDATLADLNGRFRGREAPTNVLSWPAFDLRPPAPGAAPPPPPAAGPGPLALGDVALAAGIIVRESQEMALAPRARLAHLIVHGVLHLLGYDHGEDADAMVMEGLETRALGRLGIGDPHA